MAENLPEQVLDEGDEDTQRDKYLTFIVGNEIYGIEIRIVTEIIGIQPITEVPEVPEYVRGIINLRGKIIPVMDVRLRFKKPFRQYNDRTCVVVIEIGNLALGLIVDGVSEVLTILPENIVNPPDLKAAQNRYIRGIGKVGEEVKLLLDCDRLLKDGDEECLLQLEE